VNRHRRLDLDGSSLRSVAFEVGWLAVPEEPPQSQRLVLCRCAAPLGVFDELSVLIAEARASGWTLDQLDLGSASTPDSVEVTVGLAAGPRVLAAVAARASVARRRRGGRPVGRQQSMPPDVVERIARERDLGRSYRRIASGLEADGIGTPAGGQHWYGSTVRAAHQRWLGRDSDGH